MFSLFKFKPEEKLMKKTLFVFASALCFILTCSNSYALLVDLTAQDLKEALSFAKQHKAEAAKELEKLYCIDKKDGFAEFVTVRTK
jgi:hypothetical protein